jgi:hypothetical protein
MGDFDTKQAEQRVGTIMGDCLRPLPQTPIGPDGDRVLLQQWHMRKQWRICSSRQASPRQALMGAWTPALRRELLADLGTGRLSILTSCSLNRRRRGCAIGRRLHLAAAYGQRWACTCR